MPELPEVETIVQDLLISHILNKPIKNITINFDKIIGNTKPELFTKALIGQSIQDIYRRGKYIVFVFTHDIWVTVHLRMTGRFVIAKKEAPFSKHHHVIIEFTDGTFIIYHDTRKFGRWNLVTNLDSFFAKTGPEPLSQLTLKQFENLIAKTKRMLKPLLLDQSFIAGLGNIYVDEALWDAKLHPKRLSSTLSKKEIEHLYHAIQLVLKRGIEAQGTTLGTGKTNYYRVDGSRGKHQNVMQVFRKTGKPCPRCGTAIERIVVAQRSTHICPQCQKKQL